MLAQSPDVIYLDSGTYLSMISHLRWYQNLRRNLCRVFLGSRDLREDTISLLSRILYTILPTGLLIAPWHNFNAPQLEMKSCEIIALRFRCLEPSTCKWCRRKNFPSHVACTIKYSVLTDGCKFNHSFHISLLCIISNKGV